MSTLEKAIQIAAEAHAGQVDKAGAPYILHPLRVMLAMETDEERIVAVLHDAIEDTPISAHDLSRAGFSSSIIRSLLALTRLRNETYSDFILRAKVDDIARRVKMADLEDNTDPGRIKNPTQADFDRMAKYRAAQEVLLD